MKSWTILDVLNWTKKFFEEKNIENARLDAEWIISYVLEIKRIELYLNFHQTLTSSELKEIKSMIVRRANREPLQYILGETEFFGYRFLVDKRVLIPRSETELLVDQVLKEDFKTVLDIGTGSGAIAITIKKEKPFVEVSALDISLSALEVAKENAILNDVNINFIHSDVFENVSSQKFDIIISNPPYISLDEYKNLAPEVNKYEPKSALVAENNGLKIYERILKEAKDYLSSNGKIFFEIGYNHREGITELSEKYGFRIIEILKDYNKFDRIAIIGI